MINTIFRILNGIKRRYEKLIWNLRLKEVGNSTIFDSGVKIYNPQNISIGNNCVINNGVILQSCEEGKITVGNNVIISYNAIILTCGLDTEKFPYEKVHLSSDVIIGNNVWIGVNVTILPGVTIGNGSIVAAGSVVTKNIADNCIAGGIPAKIIKETF